MERLIRPLDASTDPVLQETPVLLDSVGEMAEIPERSDSAPVRSSRRRHRERARVGTERGDWHGRRRQQSDRRRHHLVAMAGYKYDQFTML